jgi:2,3-bisphosphoglycerate-dependent phosphoglycerate mutase
MGLDALPSPGALALPAPADQLGEQAAGPVLWLVRHGESTWNALGLAQGQSDQPRLTSRGTRQARDVTRQLRGGPISAVYASDLQRAVATATPLAAALSLDFTRDPRLRERGLGVLEGTRSVAVPAALSGVAGSRVIDADARPPDGESLRDMYWRVAGFADDLLAASPPPAGSPLPGVSCPVTGSNLPEPVTGSREIAVVAHGGTLRVLTAYLRGVPVERMTWEPIGNGCILRLQPHPPACS